MPYSNPENNREYHRKRREAAKLLPIIFYVYLWLRYNGDPYYVGKGKGYRAFDDSGHRFKAPNNKKFIITQVYKTEEEAFEAEKFFIAYYGRKDLGTGFLRNLTDGGEGVSGTIFSKERRERLSKFLKVRGFPPWTDERRKKWGEQQKGRRLSEETKKKIGEANSRVRKGMKFSEEHRRNISKATSISMMGNTHTKGKPWSTARREAQNKRKNAAQGIQRES